MLRRFHLVRNREALERLQREIAIVPNEGDITREQIRKLPFLQCCLNESLFILHFLLDRGDINKGLSTTIVSHIANEHPVRE